MSEVNTDNELVGTLSGASTLEGTLTIPERLTIQANKNVAPSTSQQVVEPDSGYDAMAQVTVGAVSLQDKSVTPSSSQQTVTADQGYNGLGTVTVGAAPAGNDRLPDFVDGSDTTKQITISGNTEYNPHSMQTMSLPDTVHIGNYAFAGANNLTNLSAPNCTYIGDGSFAGITMSPGLTLNLPLVETVGQRAFENSTSITSLSLPSVTDWGKNSVMGAGTYVCTGCGSLVNLSLPNATSIEQYAFSACYALVNVDLPKVTEIASNAFRSSSAMETITLRANQVCTLANTNAFSASGIGIKTDSKIYVPADFVDSYKNATNWSTYASKIEAIPA